MNIINKLKISKITALSALVLVFGAVTFVAPQAHASTYGNYGNGYYSGGYNSGYNSGYNGGYNNNHGGNNYYGGNSYYPTTNTNHTSSSASSASASSASNNTTVTVSNPVTVTVPVTVIGGQSTPIYAPVSTPIYAPAPVAYNYPSYTPSYYSDSYAQLGGSCYAQTTNANVGQNITWIANAYGGNGNNYTYSWSGAGGIYGYGPTMSFAYNTPGTMVANVTITSGSQSVSVPCNSDVIVNGGYNYGNNYGYNYGTNYNTNSYYGTSLSATCSANTTSASVGQPVTWTANVTGGSGYYTYSWSGSGNLYGSGASINATYPSNGQQYADVTVTSNGQSVTAQCTNSVIVGNGNYGNPIGNGLNIGCAAGAAEVRPGTPVTWSVEATGGSGQYTYAWSGTDSLAGSQSSVATTYETPGTKQAVVIVTSSDGLTGSKACTPLTVIGGGNGGSNTHVTPTPPNTNNSGLSAASLFSLANIPWGWVAVLIILVLFGTVMYMLFNKNKI